MSAGVTILGQFSTVHGEEQETTKTFRIPGSRLIVTASVFYTDEIMPTEYGASMMLALVIGDKPQESALEAQNNAVAEIPDSPELDIMRVKQYIKVNGRTYLIGLQCNRPQKPKSGK